jgi:membrane protease YdiL (CAAX protease family)
METTFNEIAAFAVAYLSLAACGAIALAALWRFTSVLHEPWLPLQRLRHISWHGIDVFGAFMFLLAVPPLVYVILLEAGFFHWMYGDTGDSSVVDLRRELWLAAFAEPLIIALVCLNLRLLRGTRLAELGLTHVRMGVNIALGYLQWLILVPLTEIILVLAVIATPVELRQEQTFTQLGQQQLTGSEWLMMMIGAIVLAPLAEEIIFRGILLPWQVRGGWEAQATVAFCTLIRAVTGGMHADGKPFNPLPTTFVLAMLPGVFIVPFLQRRRPAAETDSSSTNVLTTADHPHLAIFTNGLFFATMHTDWPAPIPLFFLGIGLAWIAYRTSSLVGAITLHALFNATSALELLLNNVWQ